MSCKDRKPCEINFEIESPLDITMQLGCSYIIDGGGSGTKDYNKLINKPQINNITLVDNKTSKDLGLQDEIDNITEQDIDNIIYL